MAVNDYANVPYKSENDIRTGLYLCSDGNYLCEQKITETEFTRKFILTLKQSDKFESISGQVYGCLLNDSKIKSKLFGTFCGHHLSRPPRPCYTISGEGTLYFSLRFKIK